MKTVLLSGLLALAFAATAGAADPAPASLASLDRDVQALSGQLRDLEQKNAQVQERLDAIEQRLGDSFRGNSPFDTVERRLEELEKDVDDLERGR